MVVNSTDPGRFNEETTDKDREDGNSAPRVCPQTPQSGTGAEPMPFLSYTLLGTLNIDQQSRPAATEPELKTNPDSDRDHGLSRKYRNSKRIQKYGVDGCYSAGRTQMTWHCRPKAMSTKASPLCQDLCSTIPIPHLGWAMSLAPALRLTDGEARLVKSSAYSLHHHEGHRTAVGRLASSLRGRIQP